MHENLRIGVLTTGVDPSIRSKESDGLCRILRTRIDLINQWNQALGMEDFLIPEQTNPDIWIGDNNHLNTNKLRVISDRGSILAGTKIMLTAQGKAIILLKKRALSLANHSLGVTLGLAAPDKKSGTPSIMDRRNTRDLKGPTPHDVAELKNIIEQGSFQFQDEFQRHKRLEQMHREDRYQDQLRTHLWLGGEA